MATPQKIESLPQLRDGLLQNESLMEEMKNDPVAVLERFIVPNTAVYRLIVWFLGLALVISLMGAVVLFYKDPTIATPAILVSTASAAIGVIAGLLAPQATN
ncbi:MAG: hypothetical protein AAFO61_00030 [Pseudomonadota bacterium]